MRNLKASLALSFGIAMIAQPSHAEYDEIIRNIERMYNTEAQRRAYAQGRLVGELTEGFLTTLVDTVPNRRARNAAQPLVEYVGEAVGSYWEDRAAEKLSESGAELAAREGPAAAELALANRASREAEEARIEAEREAVRQRKATVYGPPKPNAFY